MLMHAVRLTARHLYTPKDILVPIEATVQRCRI
jgi:hypothetical protein